MKAGWKARKYNMSKKLGLAVSLILVILSLFTIFIFKSINKGETDDQSKLVVVSPHPTEFMIPLIQEFENETGISVELRSYGTKEAIECITKDEFTCFSNVPSVIVVNKDIIGDIKGIVRYSCFMGAYQDYHVQVGNSLVKIQEYNPKNKKIYKVGDTAFLNFEENTLYAL